MTWVLIFLKIEKSLEAGVGFELATSKLACQRVTNVANRLCYHVALKRSIQVDNNLLNKGFHTRADRRSADRTQSDFIDVYISLRLANLTSFWLECFYIKKC